MQDGADRPVDDGAVEEEAVGAQGPAELGRGGEEGVEAGNEGVVLERRVGEEEPRLALLRREELLVVERGQAVVGRVEGLRPAGPGDAVQARPARRWNRELERRHPVVVRSRDGADQVGAEAGWEGGR